MLENADAWGATDSGRQSEYVELMTRRLMNVCRVVQQADSKKTNKLKWCARLPWNKNPEVAGGVVAGGGNGEGGGAGGGGAGTCAGNGVAGTASTGGGGGGAGRNTGTGLNNTGGAGGSGVVIVRLPTSSKPGSFAVAPGSNTITTTGSCTVATFTVTGTLTL